MNEMSVGSNSNIEASSYVGETSRGEVSTSNETTSSIENTENRGMNSESRAEELAATTGEGLSSSYERSEIVLNPANTSYGLNQILETPDTIEQRSQISVEHYHSEAITQILDMNGKYISEADQVRIENGANSIRAVENNPNSGRSGVFRTSNGKSSIEVSVISKEQMERTTKHETNHFASKNREIIVPMPDRGGYTVYQTVGMRHTSWFHNVETGENSGFETSGRGLNEGMTTMYTNEQLSALSREKGEAAEREGVYSHATEICKQLQEIMGKDALGEAYYGGKTMALKERIDSLGGKGTFDAFQRSMDKTISMNYAERVQGMIEAQEIMALLSERKEGEKIT